MKIKKDVPWWDDNRLADYCVRCRRIWYPMAVQGTTPDWTVFIYACEGGHLWSMGYAYGPANMREHPPLQDDGFTPSLISREKPCTT